MEMAIPENGQEMNPLCDLPKDCYRLLRTRTDRGVTNMLPVRLWGANHDSFMANVKQFPGQKIKVAHQMLSNELSVFTHASETHWVSLLMQVAKGLL